MIEFKALAAEDHGDHVIVKVEQHNRGRASGADVDFHYWQTFTIRGGKITASYMAQTRLAALEAVRLRE
jgi:ketosteroid isomerase-like protein